MQSYRQGRLPRQTLLQAAASPCLSTIYLVALVPGCTDSEGAALSWLQWPGGGGGGGGCWWWRVWVGRYDHYIPGCTALEISDSKQPCYHYSSYYYCSSYTCTWHTLFTGVDHALLYLYTIPGCCYNFQGVIGRMLTTSKGYPKWLVIKKKFAQ